MPFGIEDGSTSVRIDDTAQVRSRFRFEKDMFPEVAEFALVLAGDEEGRRRALLAPLDVYKRQGMSPALSWRK